MRFELLCNELLLDLFEYLSIAHLLRAFQFVNIRFDKLLFGYLRNIRHLDFRSISKRDFNIICEQHLPSIVDQIISLHLSNDDESPRQIELFFSVGFTLRQFAHLKSLSLYRIHSRDVMYQMGLKLHRLSHLNRLSLTECYTAEWFYDTITFTNRIWSLPNLVHCHLDMLSYDNTEFEWLQSMSSSIEYVAILNDSLSSDALINLLKYTPRLRGLHVRTWQTNGSRLDVPLIPSIVSLTLSYSSLPVFDVPAHMHMVDLLRIMPNLNYLQVETSIMLMDGYQWEYLITTYLPKLKIFRFKIISDSHEIQERIDDILDSFRTYFWLNEHQWFVGCHWNSENKPNECIWLYTLPYHFSDLFPISNCLRSKSTCPLEDIHWSSNQIYNVHYDSSTFDHCHLNTNQTTFRQSITQRFCFGSRRRKLFSISEKNVSVIPSSTGVTLDSFPFKTSPIQHFSKIRKLSLRLPFGEQFWSIIPKLDQLYSLKLFLSSPYINQSHLQLLFDQAPHLYSLFCSYNDKKIKFKFPLAHIRSVSVRRLNLRGYIFDGEYSYYDDKQCVNLSCSPLGKQCQILLIRVKHRESILFLVNTMDNLRAMRVQCQDDYYSRRRVSKNKGRHECQSDHHRNEELVQWLQRHLPSLTIVRDLDKGHDVQLWIR